jgi:hypothetical protein
MGSGAVQVLEHLLTTRKQCCAEGNTGAPGPMTTVGSRDSSSGSMSTSTAQSAWDPSYNSQIRSQNEQGGMSGSGKASQHQFMTPSSTASRTGSVVSTGRAGTASAQQQQQQHQQHQHHPPQNRVPSLAPSVSSSGSTATGSSQQTKPLYDFDSQVPMLGSYHGHQHHQSHNNITTTNQLAQAHTQSHPLAPASRSSQYIPTSASSSVAGTNSCFDAADMITTMAGADPRDVRTDLGCLPNGIECEVDNQLVFNVMDRYTGQGIGL